MKYEIPKEHLPGDPRTTYTIPTYVRLLLERDIPAGSIHMLHLGRHRMYQDPLDSKDMPEGMRPVAPSKEDGRDITICCHRPGCFDQYPPEFFVEGLDVSRQQELRSRALFQGIDRELDLLYLLVQRAYQRYAGLEESQPFQRSLLTLYGFSPRETDAIMGDLEPRDVRTVILLLPILGRILGSASLLESVFALFLRAEHEPQYPYTVRIREEDSSPDFVLGEYATGGTVEEPMAGLVLTLANIDQQGLANWLYEGAELDFVSPLTFELRRLDRESRAGERQAQNRRLRRLMTLANLLLPVNIRLYVKLSMRQESRDWKLPPGEDQRGAARDTKGARPDGMSAQRLGVDLFLR